MSATEPLCRVIGFNPENLSKEERLLLDAELFLEVCKEIKEIFKIQHMEYFRLMKFNKEMEDAMIELNFIRLLIKDILESEAYDLSGIACYTHTPEDVIHDLILQSTSSPILLFSRKLIELHRSIHPHLYHSIIKKIAAVQTELV